MLSTIAIKKYSCIRTSDLSAASLNMPSSGASDNGDVATRQRISANVAQTTPTIREHRGFADTELKAFHGRSPASGRTDLRWASCRRAQSLQLQRLPDAP
jgi:hypothetical protein